jgi:hypothetical protein
VDSLRGRPGAPEDPAALCAYCDPTCRAGEAGDEHGACRARHLYVCLGWSTRRVADACGMSRPRLTTLLRSAGVSIAPRGAGRARPRPAGEPENLRETLTQLYVRRRLSSTQIADLVGMSDRAVRAKLARFGIQRRTKGRYNREDRTRLRPEVLRELAVLRDLPATDISAVTDAGYLPVLRDLHTTGVPVRLGGNPPASGPERIGVIEALYADDGVRSVLDDHGIPRVPPGGQLWERFPVPFPLTPDLLRRLYLDCGLSAPNIEVLTGQPAATVRNSLVRWDIPRRQPGGRSPFLRRWRAAHGRDGGHRQPYRGESR